MRVVMLVQLLAVMLLQIHAKEAAALGGQANAGDTDGAKDTHETEVKEELMLAQAEQAKVEKTLASEKKEAEVDKEQTERATAKASAEMKTADAIKVQAEQLMAKAKLEMKQANAKTAKAEEAISYESSEVEKAQADQLRFVQATAKANAAMKDADVTKAIAKQLVAKEEQKIEQASDHATFKVDQAVIKMKAAMEVAHINKQQVAAQATDMEFGFTALCVILLLLLVAVASLQKQVLKQQQSLAESLLADAEAEAPRPKPFEGKWKREDGKVVRIDGDKILHENGKQEQIADLEGESLYTHRMTLKKGWFVDDQIVKGAAGKIEDGRIKWHDGRVWVKADEEDDNILGA